MNPSRTVAMDEWRYWLRSRLALAAAALFMVLVVATVVLTALRVDGERHARAHAQEEAERVFFEQPDRHPHRMVHYGHYAFRTPPPLAVFDPGIDSVTGQLIFLEGHRQNSTMFADSAASADLGALSWLSPAMVYQLLAPLLIVLLGHGAIVRERESSTLAPLLAQGLSGRQLLFGKFLALLSAVLLMLLPLLASALVAIAAGERWLAALTLTGVYLLYLANWTLIVLLVSSVLKSRATVLAALVALWLVLTLLLPSIAVNNATRAVALPGKIETDLSMLADLRELGDGHNANDPAFQQLRAELLRRYDVEEVKDLPVNIRGIVAQEAEATLTDTLNAYAEKRLAIESRQAQAMALHGWVSPFVALGEVSRALSGTDLATHHRFQRETEALRYEFVQGLNRIHAEQLAYSDDINRSADPEAERRTRVAAENWRVLGEFRFEQAAVASRLAAAAPDSAALMAWFALLCAALFRVGRGIAP